MEAEKALEITEESIETMCEDKRTTRIMNRVYRKITKRANKGYYNCTVLMFFVKEPIIDIILMTLEQYGFVARYNMGELTIDISWKTR